MLAVNRVLLFGLLLTAFPTLPEAAASDRTQLDRIAKLVFQNECAAKESCLTSWNKGEEFASLGIGHFIWYPADTPDSAKHFSESFPRLIHFMRQRDVEIPVWVKADQGCPWPNRDAFESKQKSKKMRSFRLFLIKTMSFQANFMQKRMKNALPLMLSTVPQDQRRHIRRQFERVANAPMGMYALVDYVNFKGEGVNPKESYQGQGWGLLQVLTAMHGQSSGITAIIEFSNTADMLLTRRVALSPPARHESRWLAGWKKRTGTYVTESRKVDLLPLE